MQELFERRLLKLLLDHDFYKKYARLIPRELFPRELAHVYDAITSAHEKYKKNLHPDEVVTYYTSQNSLTTAARHALKDVFEDLGEIEPTSPELAADFINAVLRREKARQVMEVGAKILNGDEESFEAIQHILSEVPDATVNEPEPCTTDIVALLEQSDPKHRFPFFLAPLQEKISGAGRGNLIIVFGRPEVGKSSFVSNLVVGYLKQGLKVAYFANEEPTHKIMLNNVRCFLGAREEELRRMVAEKAPFKEWSTASQGLVLLDAVGYSVRDVANYVDNRRPDVVVLDQADKLGVSGSFNAGHERLKQLYIATREIAKRGNCLVVDVCQASAEAEGKRYLSFDMMDESRTGKAGEADIVIGIGKNPNLQDDDGLRYLTVSKNKITGWHGSIAAVFNGAICRYSE